MKQKQKRITQLVAAYGLVLPSFLLIVTIVAYPIINSVIQSFAIENTAPVQYGLDNYRYIFTNKLALSSIYFTLVVATTTVVFAVICAYGLALYLRFFDSGISKSIGLLYLIPRFIPGLVAVNGMITMIRNTGFFNRLSLFLFGYDLKPELMNTGTGLVLMNLWFNIPFATMIISSALSSIPDSMIESARDVGASKLQVFKKMILPLTLKDSMIAVTFIFMSNVSAFTTPYLMGPTSPKMMSPYLLSTFSNMHYERSAAISVVMFLICSISAIVYIYTNMKEKEWEKDGKGIA